MLEAEFVRDLHNHYIVLKGIEGKAAAYGTRMLLNNQIPGLLITELRCIDQTDLFYYDITSKKSLSAFCENKSLNHSELKNILASMLKVIENSGNYLLSENDFIIDPNYIFISGDSLEIGFCHLPGSQEQIQEQLSRLMEYLMNKVDYKDETAVVLIYAMYKATKEPDCTFAALLKELEKKTEPRVKKITIDTELSVDSNKPPLIGENDKSSGGDAAVNKRQAPSDNPSYQRQEKRNIVDTNGTVLQSGKQKNHKSKQQRQIQKKKNNTLRSKQIQGKTNKGTSAFLKKNASAYSGKLQILYKVIIENCLGKNIKTDRNPVKSILREEVVSEREYQYFGPATFVLAGVSVIAGIVLLIAALYLKLLHNTFGTHIDGTKFFSCVLILSCLEVYVFIKLFDSKNKISGIRTVEEEVEAEDLEEDLDAEDIEKARKPEARKPEARKAEARKVEDRKAENRKAVDIKAEDSNMEYPKVRDPEIKYSKEKNYEEEGSYTQDFAAKNSKSSDTDMEAIYQEINSGGIHPDKNGVYDISSGLYGQGRPDAEQFRYRKRDIENVVRKAGVFAGHKLNDLAQSDGATQVLWMDKADSSQEATVILSRLSACKLYRLTTTDSELRQDVLVRDFPFYIGKLRKGVDLTIDDKSVSRRHARLTKAGEDIFLTDLNSTNGTYLNNIKLQENKPYLVRDKDEISFSQINYTWNVEVQ